MIGSSTARKTKWNPANLGAKQWIDSQLGSPGNGGAIDQAGRAANLTSVSLDPTYNASGGAHNLPYWAFRKASALLNACNLATALRTGPKTIYLVYRLNSTPTVGNLYSMGQFAATIAGLSSFFEFIVSSVGGAQPREFAADIQGSNVTSSGFAAPADSTGAHVLEITYNGAGSSSTSSYTANWDGTNETLAASSALNILTTNKAAIGGRVSSANALSFGADMDYYGGCAFLRLLNLAERMYIRNVLIAKYT